VGKKRLKGQDVRVTGGIAFGRDSMRRNIKTAGSGIRIAINGSAVMIGSENTGTSVSVHATSSSEWSLITSAVQLEKPGRGFFALTVVVRSAMDSSITHHCSTRLLLR